MHDYTVNKLLLVFRASAWVIRFPPVVVAGDIAGFSYTLASKGPIWTKSVGKVLMGLILTLPLLMIRPVLLLCC